MGLLHKDFFDKAFDDEIAFLGKSSGQLLTEVQTESFLSMEQRLTTYLAFDAIFYSLLSVAS